MIGVSGRRQSLYTSRPWDLTLKLDCTKHVNLIKYEQYYFLTNGILHSSVDFNSIHELHHCRDNSLQHTNASNKHLPDTVWLARFLQKYQWASKSLTNTCIVCLWNMPNNKCVWIRWNLASSLRVTDDNLMTNKRNLQYEYLSIYQLYCVGK